MSDIKAIGDLTAWNNSMLTRHSFRSSSSEAQREILSTVKRNREWIAQHQLAIKFESKKKLVVVQTHKPVVSRPTNGSNIQAFGDVKVTGEYLGVTDAGFKKLPIYTATNLHGEKVEFKDFGAANYWVDLCRETTEMTESQYERGYSRPGWDPVLRRYPKYQLLVQSSMEGSNDDDE